MGGLKDILNDADGKRTYIRVRMRKLVKFENSKKKKKNLNRPKLRNYKSSNDRLEIVNQQSDRKEINDDAPPIWIESHFSRPLRLFLHNQSHGKQSEKMEKISLSDL